MIDNGARVQRLTALWALSEAALGGVLHAFQVPFTGLFINGASVVFITLIACYSPQKRTLLEATAIVLIVKAGVSPHTPLNAYFAVSVQGVLGSLLFRPRCNLTASAMTLGILSMLQSSLQRIIVLTIIFGKNLWDSIDIFGNYLIEQTGWFESREPKISISLWLIAGYMAIHVIAGIFIGIFAARIPGWVSEEERSHHDFPVEINRRLGIEKKRKKQKRWLKPGTVAIILLAAIIVILTYVFPELESSSGRKAIVMVVRSVVIMLLWYAVAGPFLRRLYNRRLARKKYKYSEQVRQSIEWMPALRSMVAVSWQASAGQRGVLKRVKKFITLLVLALFTIDIPKNE